MEADAVIADLYAAANGRIQWRDALDRLAVHLGLFVAQVGSVDMRTGGLMFTAYGGYGATPEASLDYVRTYNAIDPRIPASMVTPPDSWMLSNVVHDKAFVATSPFYQEFLIPYGGGAMAGTKLVAVDDAQFMLAMVRPHGAAPLDPQNMPFLNQLKFHLCEAFRNLLHIRESYAELGMARELLEQFRYPMLLVDQTRGILHQNARAAEILDQGEFLSQQSGYLFCREKAHDIALTEAIHSLRLNDSLPGGKHAVMLRRKKDGSRLIVFASAVRPSQTMGIFGSASRALLVLHPLDDQETTIDPFIISEAFGLTPAEARIGTLLATGYKAKQIATRNGTALSTVQSQIKSLLEKVGVSSQSDLIRVLTKLPMRAS